MGSGGAGGGAFEKLIRGGKRVVGREVRESSVISRALGFGVLLGDDAWCSGLKMRVF